MKFTTIHIIIIFFITNAIFSLTQILEWEEYPIYKHILDIKADYNFVWVGTTSGLVKVDKSKNEISFYMRTHPSKNIAIDSNGSIWTSVDKEGLAKFDGMNWLIYDLEYSDCITDLARSIEIDK